MQNKNQWIWIPCTKQSSTYEIKLIVFLLMNTSKVTYHDSKPTHTRNDKQGQVKAFDNQVSTLSVLLPQPTIVCHVFIMTENSTHARIISKICTYYQQTCMNYQQRKKKSTITLDRIANPPSHFQKLFPCSSVGTRQ